jgi:MoxR-like ATPase
VYGLSLEEVATRSRAVLDEVERAVVGKRAALRVILLALLADGHVLIEDAPGLAKTLTARSFATVTGLAYGRVQFTPDLLPADITGSEIFDQRTGAFEFRPGPVFTQVLLADEVNRAPPRAQAALLEAMQERQVTSDGQTRRLPRPFLVIATQNPLEFEGTYPLPEAQLDRFLVRCKLGYPTADEEWEVLRRRLERGAEQTHLEAVVDAEGLLAMQAAIEQVHVAESIGRYIVDLVAASRAHARVQVGASPRGALALLALARAAAALEGRDYVIPEDVKAVTIPALAHRLALRPEAWVRRVRGEDVIEECLASTPSPPTPEPT